MDHHKDDSAVESQISLWTRVTCGVLVFGLWLCATSIYLLTEI
ncbi:hypothetical protein [Azospirillum doebereinerae]